jgi:hypothetical protein
MNGACGLFRCRQTRGMRRPSTPAPAVFLLAGLVFAGCRQEEVRVYQAPREEEALASSGASAPSASASRESASARPAAPWTVPEGWVEQPASGMRVASYRVSAADGRSADISVVALQGESGGELANVNRWRNQAGLDALTEAQLDGARTPAVAGRRPVTLYEIVGEKPLLEDKYRVRTLAAILPAGEMTVFFKMTGEDALVAAEKPKFLSWLRSVETGEREESSSTASATATESDAAEVGLPRWEVPAGWRAAGPRPMRLASFEIPDAAGAGDVSISSLAGDGGGLLANVNRWRGQVGLPAQDEATVRKESKTLETAGGDPALLVDLAGSESRILGAIVVRGGQSWFFKLTAKPQLAERERAAFEGFVRSLKF